MQHNNSKSFDFTWQWFDNHLEPGDARLLFCSTKQAEHMMMTLQLHDTR